MQKFKAAEGVLINNIRTLHKQFPVEFGEEKDGNYNSNHSLVMRRRFEMSELKITGTIFNYWDNIPSITRSDMIIRGRVARRQVEVRQDRKVAA